MAGLTDSLYSALAGTGPSAEWGFWAEALGDVLWLLAGFALVRAGLLGGLLPKGLAPGFTWPVARAGHSPEAAHRRARLKSLRADAAAGHTEALLRAWEREGASGPLPLDLLRSSAQALAVHAPQRLAAELTEHLELHHAAATRPATLRALVESLTQAGRPDLAEELGQLSQTRLGLQLELPTLETLMAGFAAAGEERRVRELAERLAGTGRCVSARGHALITKGFLQSRDVEAAARQLLDMCRQGLQAPPRALTELFRTAARAGPEALQRTLATVGGHLPLPSECLALLLADCARREDLAGARHLERLAGEQGTAHSYGTYEPLLKLYAKADGKRAREVFKDMQRDGFFATEGLCGSLLARCSEAQNLDLAEDIAAYLRGRSMMSLAIYKTLMKVYACCSLFDRACGLYKEVLADGLEPDHVMYGCLVKFAVKCGDVELAQELFGKVNGGDVQNYMWLIRAAGRAGDVDRAFQLLRRLQKEQPGDFDVAVYNCVLDVCLTSGAPARAQELLAEMRQQGVCNLVTFNTLIKGHCAKGDLAQARQVIGEIRQAGLAPDSASYNCLLGAAVSAGRLDEVWEVLREMEAGSVRLDHYTVSIMMKAAKRARGAREADRALSVLDRAGASVCEDEVVFNTVLDACVHRRDRERLGGVLATFAASQLRPSVHTYGLLFKAFSFLKQTDRCHELWREMVEHRGLVPNDITMSCMLDALICAGRVEEAVALFRAWRKRVPPNTVTYGTLIKGFASLGDAERAMEAYREMKADGLKVSLVAYTSLIDAQARAGHLGEARGILRQMDADGCAPNTITYSALVKGYCTRGSLGEALGLFQEMLARGLSADAVIFNTMLDGCVRHSRFELADQLLAEMAKYSVQPSNVTLSIVVKMWGKRRQLSEAFEAVHRARAEAPQMLDTQVGTCLVSACVYNRSPDRALAAFEEMRKWPCCDGPDAGTYGTLVGGLARYGRCREAVELALEACRLAAGPGARLKPLAPETLRQVFQSLRGGGLAEDFAQRLADALRLAGMPERALQDLLAGTADSHSTGERASPTGAGFVRPPGRRAGRRERLHG